MLTGYRSTPHPTTGVAPYENLMNRQVRTKLDHQTRESSENARDAAINERDERYKEKLKQYAENRNTKAHNFIVGDHVLLKQKKRNKWSTAYEPAFYTVKIKKIFKKVDTGQNILLDVSATPVAFFSKG